MQANEKYLVTFTALRIPVFQVPVERLARVADPAGDLALTGAEGSLGHRVAAAHLEEVGGDSAGVAVALLAEREVVPVG